MSDSSATINVRILVPGRHFLYLPLYYSEYESKDGHKKSFFGDIPKRYHITITPPKHPDDNGSDLGVYESLLDSLREGPEVLFAICDPNVVLESPSKKVLVAATIVASSAFWAVNHDAKSVRCVSDLEKFERIVCYDPKSTSHLIARRIVRKAKDKLTVVERTKEIGALKRLGKGTVAISPEILEIANLTKGEPYGKDRFEIVLSLCKEKEFSNVLTSALLTREDVLHQHPELVRGLLLALQKALHAIHANAPYVTECAGSVFPDAFQLEEALALARDGNVFPETIHVRKDRWDRACMFYFQSKAAADEKEKSRLTKAESDQVNAIYESSVEDRQLKMFVAEAISKAFGATIDTGKPQAKRKRTSLFYGGFAILLLGYFLGHVCSSDLPMMDRLVMTASWLAAVLLGIWSWRLFRYDLGKPIGLIHWLAWLALWYGTHEFIVERSHQHAHFLHRMPLSEAAAGWISTMAFALWIASGYYNLTVAKEKRAEGK